MYFDLICIAYVRKIIKTLHNFNLSKKYLFAENGKNCLVTL